MFSAALCRGLIEAPRRLADGYRPVAFSAALCRGLIEAGFIPITRDAVREFSAALCRGLIEATRIGVGTVQRQAVFRGFMPRPH